MKTTVLANGLRIIHVPKKGDTCTVLVNVRVGSNLENREVAGISHFIEHMLFEGTRNRPDSYIISNEIEKLGGEFNAATSNERTYYFAKVANKHFGIALDVISDIIMNPLFDEKLIEKEKGIILDEIKLVNDQPRFYQWIFFQQNLFKKHPCRNPVYGSVEAVKKLDRQKVLGFYNEFYTPGNMSVVIIGDAEDAIEKARSKFGAMARGADIAVPQVQEPAQTGEEFRKRKDTAQAYMVMGFKTAGRSHMDSYILDVARGILGRGQSGKIFNEVRNRHGLAYDVGVLHNPSTDFGYFAVYVNTNEKNIERVKALVMGQVNSLKSATEAELEEAKTFLEGEYLLQADDTQKLADLVAFWDQVESAGAGNEYVKKIMSVAPEDVRAMPGKYLKKPVVTILV